MKHALFLYNTRSGRGRIAERRDAIVAMLEAHGYTTEALELDFCSNPFDRCSRIPDLVVVAGGDGTVNHAVNHMMERNLDLEIGIIPAGTANDFAYALGMAHDPVKAAEQIATGTVERIDCGRVNGLYFVNIFSFGLFTTTSQRTPDEWKHKIGKLAYFIEGIKELRRMHAIPLHIKADGREINFRALIALIFNGETAGGFRLARRASMQDGLFDVLLLEKHNLLRSCCDMVRYLLGGMPKAIRNLRVTTLEIDSPIAEPTDVDGQRGAHFPLTIHCLKGALRIRCAHNTPNPNPER